ncbi:hypothetical protein M569_05498, partial [Genlisea aurea]
PPSSAVTATLPPIPPPSKLRLMCSYGGHIVPRPHDNSLFYSGGETRIIALDRRTTAASFSSLASHLSRALFQNLPFLLKYLLPNEDLDSLISVVCDEDLVNMLEEYDRISPPGRIRLFLFPVNSDSVRSALLERKSEHWSSGPSKSSQVSQKGLMTRNAVDSAETGTTSGGEGKLGAESVRLETSSSFGSSFTPLKAGTQDTSDQVHQFESPENSTSDIPSNIASSTHGVVDAVPQYASTLLISPYYPTYQIPLRPHDIPYQPNQPYPVYFVPIRPSQHQNFSMISNPFEANATTFSSSHPYLEPVFNPEFFGAHASESGNQAYSSISTLNRDQGASVMQQPPPLDPLISPEALTNSAAVAGEDVVFNQIYKTQPTAPVLPS